MKKLTVEISDADYEAISTIKAIVGKKHNVNSGIIVSAIFDYAIEDLINNPKKLKLFEKYIIDNMIISDR